MSCSLTVNGPPHAAPACQPQSPSRIKFAGSCQSPMIFRSMSRRSDGRCRIWCWSGAPPRRWRRAWTCGYTEVAHTVRFAAVVDFGYRPLVGSVIVATSFNDASNVAIFNV